MVRLLSFAMFFGLPGVPLFLVEVCATAFHQPSIRYIHVHQSQCRHPTMPFLCATKDEYIAANKNYLTRKLGLTKDQVQRLQTDGLPNILTLEEGVLEERVDWLKKRLKLRNNKQVRKIVQHQPHVLAKLSSTVAQKIDYLQTRLLLSDNSLRKMFLEAPHLLPCSTKNMEDTLNWLQKRLRLDDRQLAKLICRAPYTLGCSVSENLEPTLVWIKLRLNVLDDFSISRVVQKMPRILHLNIEANLEPKFDWLQHQFNLDDEALGKMVQRSPTFLGLSIDTWEVKLDWIERRLHLSDQELSEFIVRYPCLLNCNIESNLDLTLNFYIDALGNESEAAKLVTNNPSLLAYSLEKRLKPRLQESRDAGILIDAGCLRRIGQYTNDYWEIAISFVRDHEDLGIIALP
mmetsp:Transcript_3980/g.6119  ORF Transcript_3980/g.6119 Transcript_3980/m.6119 type:complete len:403 (-) Transcript_3980:20-1228(-)